MPSLRSMVIEGCERFTPENINTKQPTATTGGGKLERGTKTQQRQANGRRSVCAYARPLC